MRERGKRERGRKEVGRRERGREGGGEEEEKEVKRGSRGEVGACRGRWVEEQRSGGEICLRRKYEVKTT